MIRSSGTLCSLSTSTALIAEPPVADSPVRGQCPSSLQPPAPTSTIHAPLALLPDELSTRAVRASGQDQDLYGDGGGPTREPATPFYSPVEPDFPISLHDVSLDSVWEEVKSAKARALVGAPSKVRSLEGAGSLGGQTAVQAPDDGGYGGGREKDAGGRRRRVTRRRSRCVRPGGAFARARNLGEPTRGPGGGAPA